MSKLYIRAAARRDLVEHAVYLTAEGGEELADRFLSQVEASCALLVDQPEIGSPLVVRDPALIGIRKWLVKDFESFLIFYVPHERGVTIVRVLYGRRDWWQMLGLVWEERTSGRMRQAYPLGCARGRPPLRPFLRAAAVLAAEVRRHRRLKFNSLGDCPR